VIRKILIDAPQIGYEKAGDITNFDAIQHNVEAYLGAKDGKGEKAKQESSKKMIIDSFVIRNAKVNYNDMLELKLPDIELRNVGKKAGGATSAQVTKAIIAELNTQLAIALAKTAVIAAWAAWWSARGRRSRAVRQIALKITVQSADYADSTDFNLA